MGRSKWDKTCTFSYHQFNFLKAPHQNYSVSPTFKLKSIQTDFHEALYQNPR